MNTLVQRILELAHTRPDTVAVAFKKETLTYAQLAERIQTIGTTLKTMDIKPGDRVLFSALSKPEMVAVYLGIQYAGAIAVFILLGAALAWFVGRPLIRFAREPEVFRAWVADHGLLGMAAYTGMVFLQVLVAIIPGEPLEIAGGYAFGAVWGTVLCLLGAFLGSAAVFAVVRKWGVPLVEVFFPQDKLDKLTFLKTSPKRTALLWLVFTVPGTPKDLLCYFAGLTDLRWTTWLLIASVGRLPSIITSTVGGNALGLQNYQFAAITFAATTVIAGVGLVIYRQVCRRHKRSAEDDRPEKNT